MNDAYTSRVLAPEQLTRSEIALWNDLCATEPMLASPFLSHAYTLAVKKSGASVRVCLIYRNKKLCAFFPYQFSTVLTTWLKAAEPAGGRMTDYFGLIAAPDLTVSASQLLSLARLNQVTFTHLDESQLAFGLSGEAPRPGLRIACRAPCGAARTSIFDHKHQADLKRKTRLLIQEVGALHFTFDVQENRLQHLQSLIRQKRSQYAKSNVSDALRSRWKHRLLEHLLYTVCNECSGILSVLYAGDQWVASHFGIRGNGILQYWFPVYNPALGRYSPGKILLDQIAQASTRHAIHTIDRGEGNAQSKMEAPGDQHQFYRGVWHNGTAPTLVVRGSQSLLWRLGK